MKLEKAEVRLRKAEERHERAARKVWDLLGWGTSKEIESAEVTLHRAREGLNKARRVYESAMHQHAKVA